jgi:hypothetical protein
VTVDEDDVVELVDRLEAEDERWVPVLLEHDRGEKRRLEAVRASLPDDAAKTAQRGTRRWGLGVVREAIQESLDGQRRPESGDEAAFSRRESGWRRRTCPPSPARCAAVSQAA